jgi:hypothetical protein
MPTEGKIEIKVGEIAFTGEGSESWLSSQLDKVLKNLPELLKVTPLQDSASEGGQPHAKKGPKTTLAAFLQSKDAKTNQVRKFLATALWLQDNESKTRLATSDVSTALNAHNQGRLSNPADCLAKNVSKGHCVKDGKKQFYVGDEGKAEIG